MTKRGNKIEKKKKKRKEVSFPKEIKQSRNIREKKKIIITRKKNTLERNKRKEKPGKRRKTPFKKIRKTTTSNKVSRFHEIESKRGNDSFIFPSKIKKERKIISTTSLYREKLSSSRKKIEKKKIKRPTANVTEINASLNKITNKISKIEKRFSRRDT